MAAGNAVVFFRKQSHHGGWRPTLSRLNRETGPDRGYHRELAWQQRHGSAFRPGR